jgi:ATP-binding cassette subfamily C (CFTR/MRP) protein 1
MTEIGEKGVNLSGGQKQRVSLARAVLSDADIYLLDDPLSAVDAHVGKALFSLINDGYLKGKTRILATHQCQYLPKCDKIYVMEDGCIKASGTYQELLAKGLIQEEKETDEGEEAANPTDVKLQGSKAKKSMVGSMIPDNLKLPDKRKTVNPLAKTPKAEEDGKLIDDEEKEEGEVKWVVVKAFMVASGALPLAVLVTGLCGESIAKLLCDSWLAVFSSGEGFGMDSTEDKSVGFFIGIYLATGIAQSVFVYMRTATLLGFVCFNASKKLHTAALKAVLRAPTSFFDTTPLGRILNRFTRDIECLDTQLPMNIQQFLGCASITIGTVVFVTFAHPWVALAMLPLAVFYWRLAAFFRMSPREAQRIESVTRSPIFAQFSETLNGLSTVRAFGIQALMHKTMNGHVDTNNGVYYIQQALGQWLSLRLDVIGVTIAGLTGLVPIVQVTQGQAVNAGFSGLAGAYALELSTFLKHLTKMVSETEQKFNSVERLTEYIDNLMPEAEWHCLEDAKLDPQWPATGGLKFADVTMSYRKSLEPALRGVSFDIAGGQKVGVCGRTGSGKSSLMNALLRLVDFSGSILLDGVDISSVGLHTLRHRISLIPQDPVLFAASVRENLDPIEAAEGDEALMQALKHVNLHEEIERLGGLGYTVTDGGSNFSVGQRQLLCLARAVLRKSRLILLDEATASVDHDTDALIQGTIRTEFKASTVLTIAHRLNTILDSDSIIVMSEGIVAETGPVQTLCKDKNSMFSKLVDSANLQDVVDQMMSSPIAAA